jgi:hypothetical protein
VDILHRCRCAHIACAGVAARGPPTSERTSARTHTRTQTFTHVHSSCWAEQCLKHNWRQNGRVPNSSRSAQHVTRRGQLPHAIAIASGWHNCRGEGRCVTAQPCRRTRRRRLHRARVDSIWTQQQGQQLELRQGAPPPLQAPPRRVVPVPLAPRSVRRRGQEGRLGQSLQRGVPLVRQQLVVQSRLVLLQEVLVRVYPHPSPPSRRARLCIPSRTPRAWFVSCC